MKARFQRVSISPSCCGEAVDNQPSVHPTLVSAPVILRGFCRRIVFRGRNPIPILARRGKG
jgi:hypothetical protein